MNTKDEITLALGALEIAVRQNSHDMLMTGEELRKCEAAITAIKQAQEPVTSSELEKAVSTVLEGWTIPAPVRKILETAYYAAPKQAEPIQPSSQKTLALALEGKELHDYSSPEYIICAELIRLNKALSGAPTPPEAK